VKITDLKLTRMSWGMKRIWHKKERDKQTKQRVSLKTFTILIALSMLLAVPAAVLAADGYPTKPVLIIVPAAPGGVSDVFGRLFVTKLSERLGKPVLLDFRVGGGGIIGTELASKADPDGYTLLLINVQHTILPSLEKLPYDPIKSFVPIAKMATTPHSLVVHPSVPANSVKEFIALAKQKPGQLVFGTAGIGSPGQMGAELFKMMAKLDFKIVNFKGGGPSLIDLLGGHHHADFTGVLQNMPSIKAGKIRLLATTGLNRSTILPDVPTVAESLPGFGYSQWLGLLAPAGTPAPIIDRLNKGIKAAMSTDEMKSRLLEQGAEADFVGSAEFGTFIGEEMTKWDKVVKEANIKLN
jgi:tripartite-type tricarboxylate transporter receptor subunit TctC